MTKDHSKENPQRLVRKTWRLAATWRHNSLFSARFIIPVKNESTFCTLVYQHVNYLLVISLMQSLDLLPFLTRSLMVISLYSRFKPNLENHWDLLRLVLNSYLATISWKFTINSIEIEVDEIYGVLGFCGGLNINNKFQERFRKLTFSVEGINCYWWIFETVLSVLWNLNLVSMASFGFL